MKTKQSKGGRPAAEAVMWTVKRACIEFGVARSTISMGLRRDNVPSSATYTTRQIYDAITGDDAMAARKLAIAEQQERKLKIANDERDGLLVEKEDLARRAAPLLRQMTDLIYQKMGEEGPLAMAGIDVPTGRIVGRRMASEVVEKLNAALKVLGV
jgi:hypothetical protein